MISIWAQRCMDSIILVIKTDTAATLIYPFTKFSTLFRKQIWKSQRGNGTCWQSRLKCMVTKGSRVFLHRQLILLDVSRSLRQGTRWPSQKTNVIVLLQLKNAGLNKNSLEANMLFTRRVKSPTKWCMRLVTRSFISFQSTTGFGIICKLINQI